MFPISRDPPEGGTHSFLPLWSRNNTQFPISRDPPEGGTIKLVGAEDNRGYRYVSNF